MTSIVVGKTKFLIGFGALIPLLFVGISIGMSQVDATSWSWSSGVPTIEDNIEVDGSTGNWAGQCKVPASSVTVVSGSYTRPAGCRIAESNTFKLYNYYDYGSSRRLAIQFVGEDVATAIQGVDCPGDCLYLPSRDEFVMVGAPVYSAGAVYVFKNFVAQLRLHKTSPVPTDRYFEYVGSPPDSAISAHSAQPGYIGDVKHIERSDNDKWLFVEFINSGLFRYDTDTKQLLKISNRVNYGLAYPEPVYALSDNGEHITIAGLGGSNQIFDIMPGCGRALPTNPTIDDVGSDLENPCPSMSLGSIQGVANPYVANFAYAYAPQFSSDGGELSFYATSSDASVSPRFIRIQAAGYTMRQLDYLALGDSYSSGEGDTEKDSTGNKYYRPNTDTTTERCHLSTRSYPYKMAANMNLTVNTRWNTVACSGATTWDVKGQGSPAYLGQNDRLKGLNYLNLKDTALNEFIPGREKQIEFVKKYRPKVITLTMGGNDVGFSPKLQKCVLGASTCESATTGRAELKSEILGQYDNLKSLYEELYRSSGSRAKIYVLSYPNFINDSSSAVCYANVGALNTEERELIKNSVTLLNNVIRQAAKAAGVKYVDIEDSLIGHRLCDAGDKHVTGVSDPADASRNRQESFHPNAAGHDDIAVSVRQKLGNINLADYDICPRSDINSCPDVAAKKDAIEIPQYFAEAELVNVKYQQITGFDQVVNSTIDTAMGIYSFADSAVVSIVLHSDPITLGQFTASSNGSLSAQVMLPSTVEPGIHTLILSGQSRSGEPIQYEQTILIKSSNPDDVDGDGIPDAQDKCLFAPASNTDQDRDGIDDGCDPEIGAAPSPSPSSTPSTSPSPNPMTENPIAALVQKIVKTVAGVIKTIVSVLVKLLLR